MVEIIIKGNVYIIVGSEKGESLLTIGRETAKSLNNSNSPSEKPINKGGRPKGVKDSKPRKRKKQTKIYTEV